MHEQLYLLVKYCKIVQVDRPGQHWVSSENKKKCSKRRQSSLFLVFNLICIFYTLLITRILKFAKTVKNNTTLNFITLSTCTCFFKIWILTYSRLYKLLLGGIKLRFFIKSFLFYKYFVFQMTVKICIKTTILISIFTTKNQIIFS